MLRKYKSLYSSTTNTFSTGEAVTITPASVVGLPTDTEITLTFDRVDGSGTKTPDKMERIRGTITGGNFVISSGGRAVEGTEQVHTSPVVEMIWNADDWNDTVDHILTEHNQDGTHKDTLVTSLKATGAEINTGTEDAKIVTPKAIADSYLANGYSSIHRQAIINGNFDVWQRGTSLALTATTFQFLADRWVDYHSADGGTLPTLTRTREAEADGNGSYYWSKLAFNGAGTSLGNNSIGQYTQSIEYGTRYLCGNGKKVTISFWAKSDVANKKIGIRLLQNYGTGGSPTSEEIINGTNFTLTSTWTKYTHTFTTNTLAAKTFGTANDDKLTLAITYMWGSTRQAQYGSATAETYVGSGYVGIRKVQLCAGDVALPFMPKSFDDELRACMRYYEKSTPYSMLPSSGNEAGAHDYWVVGNYSDTSVRYLVPKRVSSATPVLYAVTSGTANKIRDVTNGSDIDYSGIITSDNGFLPYGNATTGHRLEFGWVVDAEL